MRHIRDHGAGDRCARRGVGVGAATGQVPVPQVRRRRRKKIPLADRQPLARPQAPNEMWSADFVFERTAHAQVVTACVQRRTTEEKTRPWLTPAAYAQQLTAQTKTATSTAGL